MSGSQAVQQEMHRLQLERGRLALNAVAAGRASLTAEFDRYTERIEELGQLRADADGIGHPVLREQVRALEASGHVKEAVARERGLVAGILATTKVEPWDYGRFSSVRVSREDRLADFNRLASDNQRAWLHAALHTSSAVDVARYETAVINGQRVDPAAWWSSMSVMVDDLRAVEQELADDITGQATQLKQDALRDLSLLLGLGVLAITVEIMLFARQRAAGQVDPVTTLVTEIAAKLLDGATVDEACRLVAYRVIELSSASCVLILRGDSHDNMRFCAGAGAGFNELRRLQVTGSCLADALSSRTPVSINDFAGRLWGKPPDSGPAVAIPVCAGSRVLGVLLAMRRAGAAPFGSAEVARLLTITSHAAGALERQVEVEEERNRIAHALYPVAFRRLIGAGMSLQSALTVLPDTWARRRVETAIDELDDTVQQMRIAIFDLESVADRANLRQRLLHLTVELTKDADLRLTVCVQRSVDHPMPAEMAEHVEAVVHETVSNVISHAGVSELLVEVGATEDGLIVSVQNNGIGFPQRAVRNGLHRLEQRAGDLGGELSVTGLAAGGTRLTWRLPFARRALRQDHE